LFSDLQTYCVGCVVDLAYAEHLVKDKRAYDFSQNEIYR